MAELNSAESQPKEPMVWPYILMAAILISFFILPLASGEIKDLTFLILYAVMTVLVIGSLSWLLIKKLNGGNLFSQNELPVAGWNLTDVFIIILMWFFFFSVLLFPLMGVMGKNTEPESNPVYMLAADSIAKLLAMLILFRLISRHNQVPSEALGLDTKGLKKNIIPAIVAGILIIPVVAIIGAIWTALLQALKLDVSDQEIVEILKKASSPELIIVVIFTSVILAPVIEEIFFRGFIYRVIKKHTGVISATLITGFLFGMAHGALASIVPLSIFGMFVCYIYERSGKLWVPMIAHAIFNTSAVIMILIGPIDMSPSEFKDPLETYADAAPRQWEYIIIHHSATTEGGAKSIEKYHKKVRGWDSLGYDFVIGNGSQTSDGKIEVSQRWRHQLDGAHCPEQNMNIRAISICFVGNFDQPEKRPTAAQLQAGKELVRRLAEKYNIPPECILGHREVQGTSTKCPGKNFLIDELRSDVLKSGNKP